MFTTILLVPLAWLAKSATYWGVFRWRTIPAKVMDCLVIAGAPFLMSIVPVPAFLAFPASIGLAVYLTMHYTSVELIPDGLFVPLAIELLFLGAFWLGRETGIV